MDGEKERQGDFVFTANHVGEYRFCFDNSLSTFTEKMVDLEIAVSHNPPTNFHASTRMAKQEGSAQLTIM